MKFQSEEARLAAIQGIDEADPKAVEKLEQYKSAEIGPEDPPADTPPEGEKPPEGEITPPAEKPPEGTEPPPTPTEYKITDLKGHKSPEELLKSFDNSQDMIRRQAEKIKALEQPRQDPELTARLEKAERELAELRSKGEGTQASEAKADIKKLDEDRNKIIAILDELDRQAEEDPDVVFTKEYQAKHRSALRLSAENSRAYNDVFNQLSSDLAETKKTYTELVNGQTRSSEEKRQEEAMDKLYADMDSMADPEFKTITPSKQLASDYLAWQRDVEIAYYGRPARTVEESRMAMDQLQMRNPKIIEDCNLRKIPITPSEDMKKYLEKCELNLYRQGYRKGPNGTFDANRRVMVPNDKGEMVPYIIPTFEQALALKRTEEGYHEKRVDAAYQEGATAFAQAAGRRDQGAVTLSSGEGAGGAQKTVEWAISVLNNIDELAVSAAARAGNTKPLDEINEARKILGRDPMSL